MVVFVSNNNNIMSIITLKFHKNDGNEMLRYNSPVMRFNQAEHSLQHLSIKPHTIKYTSQSNHTQSNTSVNQTTHNPIHRLQITHKTSKLLLTHNTQFALTKYNTHTHHCYQQWSRTHYSTPHTLWALTAATILADASVTPPSPK